MFCFIGGKRESVDSRHQRRFRLANLVALILSGFSICGLARDRGCVSQNPVGQSPSTQQSQGRSGQQPNGQGQQQGLGGSQSAQPVRPAQGGAQRGQTSNQTELTPSQQSRPVQPFQGPLPQRPAQTGQTTVGEPSGTTTPRAPVGQGGLQLPNTQVPGTGAARTVDHAPSTLSLAEAVRIALENNLATLTASLRVEELRSISRQQRAAFLPNIYGTVFQQNRTLNLRAQGITSGDNANAAGGSGGSSQARAAVSIPQFVGPFNTFDARAYFAQGIFNLAAIRDYKSTRTGIRAGEFGADLAREQVATLIAIFYLNVLRSRREIDAARADLELAEVLLKLALNQRAAGVATGVDIVVSRLLHHSHVNCSSMAGAIEAVPEPICTVGDIRLQTCSGV